MVATSVLDRIAVFSFLRACSEMVIRSQLPQYWLSQSFFTDFNISLMSVVSSRDISPVETYLCRNRCHFNLRILFFWRRQHFLKSNTKGGSRILCCAEWILLFCNLEIMSSEDEMRLQLRNVKIRFATVSVALFVHSLRRRCQWELNSVKEKVTTVLSSTTYRNLETNSFTCSPKQVSSQSE